MDLFGQQIQLACVGVEAGTFQPVGWVPRLGGGEHRVLGGPDGLCPCKTASSKCRPQVSGRVSASSLSVLRGSGGLLHFALLSARLSDASYLSQLPCQTPRRAFFGGAYSVQGMDRNPRRIWPCRDG